MSYGISITTLEEVFLRVGEDDEEHMKLVKNIKADEANKNVDASKQEYSIAHDSITSPCTVFWLHFFASF